MPAYTIVRVIEEPDLVGGKSAPTIRVEYTVGDDGPFFERWPKADFTEASARDRLTTHADALERLRRGY